MLENEKNERFACFRLQSSVQANTIKKALLAQKGVLSVSINFYAEKAFVRFNTQEIRVENIIDTAKKFGVSFAIENETTHDLINRRRESEFSAVKYNLILCSILVLPLLISMFFKWFDIDVGIVNYLHNPVIQMAFAAPIVLLLSFRHIINMVKSPFSFSTLVVLGSYGAFFLSVYYGFFEKDIYRLYFDTSAIILIAAYFAKFFEMRTKIKISDGLSEITNETAATVTVIRNDNKEELIAVEQLCEGDVLTIQSGERIAADGIIISGMSSIDERELMGTNFPIDKKVGDKVFAGTINTTNPITVCVNAAGENTELAKIVRMVEDVQTNKNQNLLLIEKISRIFIAAVLVIAVICAVVNLALGKSIADVIVTSIGILVVTCPCALGLAISTPIMVGNSIGIKYGILFRVGAVFEKLRKIKALLLGKSEIISDDISVIELKPFGEYNLKALQNILFSISAPSKHQIAKVINKYCKLQGGTLLNCNGFDETAGGFKAEMNGSIYSVGTYEYCNKSGGNISLLQSQFFNAEINDEFVNIVMKDGEAIAVISFGEIINETARWAVSDLRNFDIDIYMLTNDSRKSSVKTAAAVDIENDRVLAELNYEEKARAVSMIMKENENAVAMAGSTLNDTLALSNSDVAISMGTIIDIKTDISDVVIINDDLTNINRAIIISDKTTQIISQNLILACVFNIIGIPFAIFGVIDPAIASLAMVISSVCVAANSFRIESFEFN